VKPTLEQIGDLLALKRDERPEEGYWQDFLCEFHQSQREQAVKNSGFSNFFAGVSAWFSDLSPSKWAYGSGMAYAALTIAFFLTPPKVEKENTPASPVNYQVVPAPTPPGLEQLKQLDLSPTTQGDVGEQVF
jgi:hypothetical protein